MRVIVSCHAVAAQAVIPQLIKSGLTVESVLDAIGIITGEIDDNHLADLQNISGITVEQDRTVQITPPDSPIQ